MHILHVVGARPNFMKVSPVMRALSEEEGVTQTLVHTGQHYDVNMSDIFFSQLGIAAPDINLEAGSGSHGFQTAQVMTKFEKVIFELKPDWVLVYGDINSTLAASIVCAKLNVRFAHVEAGLRSFDRTMPEEINRIVTDSLADILFTPSEDGTRNLLNEGISNDRIHLVGNVMIDTLIRMLPEAEKRWIFLMDEMNIEAKKYGVVTLHRPSNVDDSEIIVNILRSLLEVNKQIPVIFPVHPRTIAQLKNLGMDRELAELKIIDPVGYIDFLALQAHALFVVTDSGGIQEETTYLKVPCLTVRDNTERPVTVNVGTNKLVGKNMMVLMDEVRSILLGNAPKGEIPQLWDGNTSKRIAKIICQK
jgi:UDP-N-acetylglucosamine 2-epimerase (non-hydrolysing)